MRVLRWKKTSRVSFGDSCRFTTLVEDIMGVKGGIEGYGEGAGVEGSWIWLAHAFRT